MNIDQGAEYQNWQFASNAGNQEPAQTDRVESNPILNLHRVSILHDGVEIMGMSVTLERPQNNDQMIEIVRELLDCMTAPEIPNPETL